MQRVGLWRDDVLPMECPNSGICLISASVRHKPTAFMATSGTVTHDDNFKGIAKRIKKGFQLVLISHTGDLPHKQLYRAMLRLLHCTHATHTIRKKPEKKKNSRSAFCAMKG